MNKEKFKRKLKAGLASTGKFLLVIALGLLAILVISYLMFCVNTKIQIAIFIALLIGIPFYNGFKDG